MMSSRTALVAALLYCAVSGAAAKTLVYCIEASPDALNPQLTTAGTTYDAVSYPVYDRLVKRDPATSIISPDAAESWDISPDGLTYTFRLRRGMKFHANAKFTPTRTLNADDVMFSYGRMHDPAHPFHKTAAGQVYPGYESDGMRSIIDRIEKVDELTVRMRLQRPDATFLAHLANNYGIIMSAEYAARMQAAGTPAAVDTDPVGTGPFQFVSYQKDIALRYKPFDGYWGKRPKVDALVMVVTPDASVRYAKLKQGECHIMSLPKPADVPAMRADPALTVSQVDGSNVGYVAFNTQKKPFDNKLVRQALNLATDKARLLKTVYQGDGRIAKNPLPPTMWGYNDRIADYGYDPAKARTLLAQAGYPDGFEAELYFLPVNRPYNPDGKRMAELLQDDWAKVGVKVKLVTYNWTEYQRRVRNGEHQAAMFGWSAAADPDDFIGSLLTCAGTAPGGGNIARWCNRDAEALAQKARQTPDTAERTRLYEQFQAVFHEESPWLPIAHGALYMPMRKEVSGYVNDPGAIHSFHTVELK